MRPCPVIEGLPGTPGWPTVTHVVGCNWQIPMPWLPSGDSLDTPSLALGSVGYPSATRRQLCLLGFRCRDRRRPQGLCLGPMAEKPIVTVRPLLSVSDPAFYDAMELYVETFPRDERVPVREMAEMVSEASVPPPGGGRRHHVFVAEAQGQVVGMRQFSYYKAASLGFFVYITVLPEWRRQGVGRMLVESAVAQCKFDAVSLGGKLDAIMFECERPELAEGDERQFREDRLTHFRKLGARIVSRTYLQPALADGYSPVPLYLLAYPQRDQVDWRQAAVAYSRICLGLEPGSKTEVETLKGIE